MSATCFILRASWYITFTYFLSQHCAYRCGTLKIADSGGNTTDHKRRLSAAVLGQKSQNLWHAT